MILYVLLHTNTTRHFPSKFHSFKAFAFHIQTLIEFLGHYFNKFKKFERIQRGVTLRVTFTLI